MASINDKLRKYKSLFSTTLSTGIGTGTSDTITPATVTGLPTDTAITLTIDRVDSSGTATPSKLERIKGIISGGNLIDYVRGVDGTTEQAHSAGAVVEMVWNAADLNDIVDWGLVGHNQNGTHKPTVVTSYTPAGAGTTTLDLSKGNIHSVTMPAATQTLAISNATTGQCFIVEINNVTSQGALTWFTTIRWVDGTAPTLTGTNGKRDTFGFRVTGTDTYDGYVVGQNL
jgi:hypothetical protein